MLPVCHARSIWRRFMLARIRQIAVVFPFRIEAHNEQLMLGTRQWPDLAWCDCAAFTPAMLLVRDSFSIAGPHWGDQSLCAALVGPCAMKESSSLCAFYFRSSYPGLSLLHLYVQPMLQDFVRTSRFHMSMYNIYIYIYCKLLSLPKTHTSLCTLYVETFYRAISFPHSYI